MTEYNNVVYFFSSANKHLLWDLMYSNGIFSKIPSKNYNDVKSLFENKLRLIYNTHKDSNDLTKLNKYVISDMVNEIKIYEETTNIETTNIETSNIKGIEVNKELITSSEIKNKNLDNFHNNLTLKQNEFEDLINREQPKRIDFSENIEEDERNIDEMLEATIKKRESELNYIYNERYNDESKNNILKIDEQINIDSTINTLQNPKKVTFSDDIEYSKKEILDIEQDNYVDERNFFSKLKINEERNTSSNITIELNTIIKPVISRLDKMELELKRQDSELELLKDKNEIIENYNNLLKKVKENYDELDERIRSTEKIIDKLGDFSDTEDENMEDNIEASNIKASNIKTSNIKSSNIEEDNSENVIESDTLKEILKYKKDKLTKKNNFWNNKIKLGHKEISKNSLV